MDWKEATPEQYYLYFHCQTKLIETFKTLYPAEFHFEGNRAMVFQQSDKIDIEPLKHCISMAHDYHRIRHLPMLGAQDSAANKFYALSSNAYPNSPHSNSIQSRHGGLMHE